MTKSQAEGSDPRGRLVVVSGPSGVGKTAVVDRLLRDRRFGRTVTATTRAPRGGERDGIDYHFLDRAEFERRLVAGWFLEHADVYGSLYGTPREGPAAVCTSGRHCLLNVDVQGASELRRLRIEALYVFLAPPSLEELARRLAGRGFEEPEALARRRAAVAAEMAQSSSFDLVLVNDDLETTARKLAAAVGIDLSS